MTYLRQDTSPLDAVILDVASTPSSLSAAYTAMAQKIGREPDRWVAWKLGGTNHGSQAAFNVARGYFGAIDRAELLVQPKFAPAFPLFELKGEVEIALRIAANGEDFDAWCVCLEMPSSPIVNLLEAGVTALVADRCAAGALLLGPQWPTGTLATIDTAEFILEVDGSNASVGTIKDLVASPQECFRDFLMLARENGFLPQPGDWVATGGITKCLKFSPGAHVRVLFSGDVILDFSVVTGAV